MQWISEVDKRIQATFSKQIGELIPKDTRLGKSEIIMEAKVRDTE